MTSRREKRKALLEKMAAEIVPFPLQTSPLKQPKSPSPDIRNHKTQKILDNLFYSLRVIFDLMQVVVDTEDNMKEMIQVLPKTELNKSINTIVDQHINTLYEALLNLMSSVKQKIEQRDPMPQTAARLIRMNKFAATILEFPKKEPVPEQAVAVEQPDISPMPSMDQFAEGYIDAALATTVDEGSIPLDRTYGVDDIDKATLRYMIRQCDQFWDANRNDLIDAKEAGVAEYRLGVCFWYNRNGHGAGYQDEGLGDAGERLRIAAGKFGEYDLLLGDNEKIYGYPSA